MIRQCVLVPPRNYHGKVTEMALCRTVHDLFATAGPTSGYRGSGTDILDTLLATD